MKKHVILFSCGVFLVLCLTISIPVQTADLSTYKVGGEELNPQNTVILANEMEAHFSQDFSPLLKHLRLDWVILDSSTVPDVLHNKNIILLGHPDDGYVGTVIREVLSEEEIETILHAEDQTVLLEKESPWFEGKMIFICSGADLLQRRNSAEGLFRQLIASASRPSDWIRSAYDFEEREGFSDFISQLQYQWEDIELPLEDLMIDVDAKSPGRITSQQAIDDVERLFYLLSHGYGGYGFFNQKGEFEQAESDLIQALASKNNWTRDTLSKLIHDHLGFVSDCHLSIEDYRFAEHHDYWYDTQFEIKPDSKGFQFKDKDTLYTVVSINGENPAKFLFPSLNQGGEPIYRIGVLSKGKPETLTLAAQSDDNDREFDVKLQRSDFSYYADDVFREDLVGGIPVIRVRGFGDSDPEELEKFVATAKSHRGDPAVIVDIRGNGGGNERWPISWIQGLTGRRAGAVFTTSELESKTSMAGRANAFIYWNSRVSDPSLFSSQAKLFTQRAERFEVGQRLPGWTAPVSPSFNLIPNETTVIVITNNLIASAGEGFVMRISQAENVLVVGENTMGCLTFGNISLHQLPNSMIKVWMPINFCIFQDQGFREEIGLFPDLWVPAEDAVNFTAAALRSGTITTGQPLSADILAQEFKPESDWRRIIELNIKNLILIGSITLGGTIWAYIIRKKPPILIVIGIAWIGFSLYWINQRSEKFIGYGFLLVGMIWLVFGAVNLIKARNQQRQEV